MQVQHSVASRADMERNLNRLKSALQESIKEVERLHNEKTQMRTEVDHVSAELNRLKSNIGRLKSDNQETVEKQEKDSQKSIKEVERLHDEKTQMRTEVHHMSAAKEQLEKDIKQLQKLLHESQQVVALRPLQHKAQIEDLTQRDLSAQREIQRLTTTLDQERAEHCQSLHQARNYEKGAVQKDMQALKDSLALSKGHLVETLHAKSQLDAKYLALSRGHLVETPHANAQLRAEQEEEEVYDFPLSDCDTEVEGRSQ